MTENETEEVEEDVAEAFFKSSGPGKEEMDESAWAKEEPMLWLIFAILCAGITVLVADPQGIVKFYNIGAFSVAWIGGIYGFYKAAKNND